MKSLIKLIEWKQKKGIEPVGEWSIREPDTLKILESGLLYDHCDHWDDKPSTQHTQPQRRQNDNRRVIYLKGGKSGN